MSSAGADGHADSSLSSVKRLKKRKRAKAAVSEQSLDDRLAAFGEAFMGSIEGPSLRTQRRAAAQSPEAQPAKSPQSATPAEPLQPGLRPSKKKRKKAAQCLDVAPAGPPSATAGPSSAAAGPPSAPVGPPSAGVTAPSSVQEKTTATGATRSAPPRMSAAEKRRFMSGKVSEIRSRGATSAGKGAHGGQSEEDREFRQTLREVLDYVTPKLGKAEQRQYEDAKIRALGGTVDKQPKMPYRLLQIRQKQRAEQRKQQMEEEKHLGVSMSANQYRNGREVDKLLRQKKEAIKEKKRRREDGFLRIGLGARESRGMAVIPKGALRARARQQR